MARIRKGGPLRAPAKDSALSGKNILLGVSGGIAAYKAPELVRLLVKAGASVRVIMTKNAHHFVTEMALATVSRKPVVTDMFALPEAFEIDHVAFTAEADAFLVAPATADILAKFASGIADDMVSTTFLSCRCPVVVAPAMHEAMWENPATTNNMNGLRSRGVIVIEPEVGDLASGDVGKGRLASLETIVAALAQAVGQGKDLAGVRLLITAGPTREPLDDVRFLSNRSSGRMGYAIAQRAADRGAEVLLLSGPTDLPAPRKVELIAVQTAEEMQKKAQELFPRCHGVIAAAAVCDFRVSSPLSGKWDKSKGAPPISLEPTPDILASLSLKKKRQVTVGFAAEVGGSVRRAREKMRRKNLDLIVVNDVSRHDIGFGSDFNEVTILSAEGPPVHLPRSPKIQIADAILDRLAGLL